MTESRTCLTAEQKARLTPEQLQVAQWWVDRNNAGMEILQKMISAQTVDAMNEQYQAWVSVHLCPHEHPLVEECMACDEVFRLLYPERVCPSCNDVQDPDEMTPSRLCPNCRTT